MTIAAVETEVLIEGRLVNLLVHVTTNDGKTGTGECWWGVPAQLGQEPDAPVAATASIVNTILAPLCVGQDERQISALWYRLTDMGQRWGDGGMLMCALSGIDLALWDLAGKRHDVPVVELLGGPVHDRLPAYASLPALRTETALTTEIGRAREAGFTAIKLHEYEEHLIEHAVAAAAANNIAVMLDVNGHYSIEEATALLPLLARLGIVWFEEPVSPMRDLAAIGRVRAAGQVAIASGENEWSLIDAERMITSGVVDYYQPEVTKIGGITAGVRHAALAEVHNVAFCPHNFRLGPSLAASIHLGFACPRTAWIEMPWTPEAVKFATEERLGFELPTVIDGTIAAPTTAGL